MRRKGENGIIEFKRFRSSKGKCEHKLYPIARFAAGKTRKKIASSPGYSMVFFWVRYSLSHAQIGLPFNFTFYLPKSLPVTLIWQPHPSRPSSPPPRQLPPEERGRVSKGLHENSFYGEYGLLSTSWSDKLMSGKRNRNRLYVHAVATEALLYRGGCQLPSSPSKLSIRAVSGEAMSEKRNLSRTVSFQCSRISKGLVQHRRSTGRNHLLDIVVSYGNDWNCI